MNFRHPVLMLFLMAALIGLLILTGSLAQPVQAGIRGTPNTLTFDRGWLLYNDEMTQYPVLAVDSSGGRHVVFNTLLASGIDPSFPYPIYYGYCAADCAVHDNWDFVIIGNGDFSGGNQSIALTPSGHPRVIWENWSLIGRIKFYYAECDTDCTQAASWSTNLLWDKYSYQNRQHYLSVDPNGGVHFIYDDDYNEPHNGAFYASCASNVDCTDPANWTEGKISDDPVNNPDLHFNATANPRMLYFDGFDAWDGNLFYAECNGGCENGDNWNALQIGILEGWDEPFYSLALTSNGAPRVAFFTNKLLYYAWCNTGCTDSLDNWTITSLGLPEAYGYWVNIQVDSSDQPQLAFKDFAVDDNDGLHYSICTAGCESASPTWEDQPVELDSDLQASEPFPVPPECIVAFWSQLGENVSFDLDANDVPHFAYGAEAHGFCNNHETMITKGLRFAEPGEGGPIPTEPTPTEPTPPPGLPRVFLPCVIR